MTKKNNHQPINEICEDNSNLKDILKKIQHLKDLTTTVKTHLPKPLSEHVSVANERDNCLVLALDSAVWATELRYSAPKLLSALKNSALPKITSIEWIIDNQVK